MKHTVELTTDELRSVLHTVHRRKYALNHLVANGVAFDEEEVESRELAGAELALKMARLPKSLLAAVGVANLDRVHFGFEANLNKLIAWLTTEREIKAGLYVTKPLGYVVAPEFKMWSGLCNRVQAELMKKHDLKWVYSAVNCKLETPYARLWFVPFDNDDAFRGFEPDFVLIEEESRRDQ